MTFTEASVILTWVALAFMALALYGFAKRLALLEVGGFSRLRHSRIQLAPLPADIAPGIDGPFLLLLISSSCQACHELLDSYPDLEVNETRFLLGVDTGDVGWDGAPHIRHAIRLDFDDLGVRTTPLAAWVDRDGSAQFVQPVGSAEALRQFHLVARKGTQAHDARLE